MFKVGVPRKSKGAKRVVTVFATLVILAGLSLLVSSAALAHAPSGSVHADLIEGNENETLAGDAYITVDGDTVSVHWHLTGDFADATITNQFVCAGEYSISDPQDRCKPGQADEGTVFVPDPIGDDEWDFSYSGDETAFQIHISIQDESGSSLLGNFVADPSTDDDGIVTDDDGIVTDDDGTVTDDDGTVTDDDGSVVVDDNTQNTGSSGDEVLGRTVERKAKALAQTGPETTVLAWFGLGLLMVGAMIRFGHFGSRAALATGSPAADELVAKTLALLERTVRPGSRNWDCHR